MPKSNVVSDETSTALAKSLFNETWSLLDKKDRSHEDDLLMVHSAHASRYHWGVVGEPVNFERGEWLISRVYSVLGRPEAALFHANECLRICKENSIGDFDLAFAYEAVARAYSITGEDVLTEKYVELARDAGGAIEDDGNRGYFMGELGSIE